MKPTEQPPVAVGQRFCTCDYPTCMCDASAPPQPAAPASETPPAGKPGPALGNVAPTDADLRGLVVRA